MGIHTSNPSPESFLDFIRIVFLSSRGAYWFIHSLILIQLCFLFSRIVASRAKVDESGFLTISIFLLAMMCYYKLLLYRTASYFLVGIIFRRFANTLPASIKIALPLIGMILAFSRQEIFYFSFIQIAWCLCILSLLSRIGRAIESSSFIDLFVWFGRNSLIVLLLHAIFINLCKPLSNLFLKLDQTGLAYSATVVVTTMLGSMIIAFFLDKIKISKYLFGVNAIYFDLRKPNI